MKNSKFGRKAEEAVAKALRGKGAEVELFPGSRGPGASDFKACWPTGTCWFGQVKASRASTKSGPAWPTKDEIRRLRQHASRKNGTAVIVLVEGSDAFCRSAKDGRIIHPPKNRLR